MGRVKTNDSTAPAANPGGQQATGKDQSLVIRYDYHEHDFEHWPRPSELELAQLAAQLARGGQVEPKQAVQMAWELYWESCQIIQADHRRVDAYFAREAELERELNYPEAEAGESVPLPKKFPVTHREVEALLLPQMKGRTADRASLIREYLFAQLVRTCLVVKPKLTTVSYWEMEEALLEQLRQRLKEEVARHYARFRNTVFDAEAYRRFAVAFLQWHRQFIAAKKAAAARKRWAKAGNKARSVSQKSGKKSLGGS